MTHRGLSAVHLAGLLLLMCTRAMAQLSLSGNYGAGSYNMSELKQYQDFVRTTLPSGTATTSSFPSSSFYEINAKWLTGPYVNIGVSFSSGKTNGGLHFSDSIETAGSEQALSYNSYQMIVGARKLFLNGMLSVEGDIRPGFTITHLELHEYRKTTTVNEDSRNNYTSTNFLVQPTVTVGGRFGLIDVHGFVGYNLKTTSTELKSGSTTLMSAGGMPVHADWSGVRFGGGLTVHFDNVVPKKNKKLGQGGNFYGSFGLGVGLDHGGIGFNFQGYAGKYAGVFAGIGLAIFAPGFNGGIKYRFSPIDSPKPSIFLLGMYGYNTAVFVTNDIASSKLFYGPTAGIGLELPQVDGTIGHWMVSLLVPFRGSDAKSYIDDLKAHGTKFSGGLWPVAISVGYRFNHD